MACIPFAPLFVLFIKINSYLQKKLMRKRNSVDCLHVLSAGVKQIDGRLVYLFRSLGHRFVVNDGGVVGECRDRVKTHAFEVVVRAARARSMCE